MMKLAPWRLKLIKWLAPEWFQKFQEMWTFDHYLDDCVLVFRKDIPEIAQAVAWARGRSWIVNNPRDSLDQNPNVPLVAVQYPSLVRFRDVLVNEYQRKMKK